MTHNQIGYIENDHCRKDIIDAKAVGLDAFALNIGMQSKYPRGQASDHVSYLAIDQLADWATSTVDRLFNIADELGFKLFFSFDMNRDYFSSPSQYAEYLKKYLGRPSYYKYQGQSVVSKNSQLG